MFKYFQHIEIFDKQIKITEITVKELKVLLKYLLSITTAHNIVIDAFTELFLQKTDLSREDIDSFNFIEFFLLLFHLKCIGSSSFIKVETTVNDKKASFNLNIKTFIERLNAIDVKELVLQDRLKNGIVVEYTLPSIKEVFEHDVHNLPCCFIKSISMPDTETIHVKHFTSNEKKLIYNSLPIHIALAIKARANQVVNYFNEINFLDYLWEDSVNLLFNFNKTNLILLIKLLFNDNLLTLLENQFMLARHGNMSIDYIENCTPGEYVFYIEFLNRALNPKKSSTGNQFDDEM